jgi:ATP adenylyltransferase
LEFDSYLWIPTKAGYVKGEEKPKVECILCSIRDLNPDVKSLEVHRDRGCISVLNLYPYNPGHLMVFPERHVLEPSELNREEALNLFDSINLAMRVLRERYDPRGFNVGYNIGDSSGASISHLHAHVVPRYASELGFVDIIGGSKILIEDPSTYVEEIKNDFRRACEI